MTEDARAVLHRVVRDLAPTQERDWSPDPAAPDRPQVLLGSDVHGAGLRIGGAWCDLTLLPSGNGRTEFFDVMAELEESLRSLTRIAVAYLEGRFRVTRERGLLRTREVLTVATEDGDVRLWRGVLGSQVST